MLGHHLQPIGLAYLTDSFVKQDVFKVYSSIPRLVFHGPDKLEFLQCLEVDGVFWNSASHLSRLVGGFIFIVSLSLRGQTPSA